MLFFTIDSIWCFLSWAKINLKNKCVSPLHKEWLWQGSYWKTGQRTWALKFFYGDKGLDKVSFQIAKCECGRCSVGKCYCEWEPATSLTMGNRKVKSKRYFPVSGKLWCIIKKIFLPYFERGTFLLCPSKQSPFFQFTQMELKYKSIPLPCITFYGFRMSIFSIL